MRDDRVAGGKRFNQRGIGPSHTVAVDVCAGVIPHCPHDLTIEDGADEFDVFSRSPQNLPLVIAPLRIVAQHDQWDAQAR